jgi:DNA helicase-2/ATP-dependent DNA helicase PcrA
MPAEALVPVAGTTPRWGSAAREAAVPYRLPVDDADDAPLRVGARVRHGRWGEGLVTGVQQEGDEWMVTVNFAAVGRKRLALQYAQLEEL